MTGTPLAGRVAIVTGAGGGIGRDHALALAADGARVVVNDLGVDLFGHGSSASAAEAVVAEIVERGGAAVADAHSVADYDTAGAVVDAAVDAFGRVDILVNNASVFRDGPFLEITPEEFEATLRVHLFGSFNMCKHAVPRMVEQGFGRVVNTTSSAYYSGLGFPAYAAAKGGLVSLTYELAREVFHHGVTVNAIAPGALTEHRRNQGMEWVARVRAAGLYEIAGEASAEVGPETLGPEYVPPAVVFLASDAAADVTGMVFEAIGASVGVYNHPTVVQRIHKDPTEGPWTTDELERLLPMTLLAERQRAPGIGRSA